MPGAVNLRLQAGSFCICVLHLNHPCVLPRHCYTVDSFWWWPYADMYPYRLLLLFADIHCLWDDADRNSLWHLGVYHPCKKRATIHDGHVRTPCRLFTAVVVSVSEAVSHTIGTAHQTVTNALCRQFVCGTDVVGFPRAAAAAAKWCVRSGLVGVRMESACPWPRADCTRMSPCLCDRGCRAQVGGSRVGGFRTRVRRQLAAVACRTSEAVTVLATKIRFVLTLSNQRVAHHASHPSTT